MNADDSQFVVRLAADDRDLRAAQRLRYEVFVEEMGGTGPLVDHVARLERDEFDHLCDHLLLIDQSRDANALADVVGVYRLLPGDRLPAGQAFYSDQEFDLSLLLGSDRRLLELGRSCVHPDYRGGSAMMLMWNRLAEYVLDRGIELMFGTASFPGTDIAALEQPLAYLHQHHLAPPALRATARPDHRVEMDRLPLARLDRNAARQAVPALLKGYLRLGGFVGDGAWIDHEFNTVDVLLIMDTTQMSMRHRDYFVRRHGDEA